ncbi:MAG: sigma-70 family RNA polymerase sigma factor [Acidobacteria bacterium]|nr:sigma-70 family RNA polymerase sigma factor [Acidobacteriota bacterium]MCB9398875.1 sigma-70 family RNA polymerase sigma factor [Acidobacteriota bacterium]
MKHQRSDEEIVDLIKGGEVDAFEILVDRYQKRLVNYIFRMINDYEAAMELSQDVFLKVYSSLDKYNPEFKFTTWVHRIASNATIDWLRKKRIDTMSLETPLSEDGPSFSQQVPSSDLGPLTQLEMSQLQDRIEKAIADLPLIYRELIVLRHLNDLSYDEIAEVLDLPLGTVKNRIFRGREMLKSALSSEMTKEVHSG